MHAMTRAVCVALLFLVACASPPKRKVPALTPQQAGALLHYNSKAETWLRYVQKNNRNCGYRLDLPDQTSQPTEIDLDHIVWCGNRPAPREFDASVSFAYDKNRDTWVITRFAD
jgi:hypothetical protein